MLIEFRNNMLEVVVSLKYLNSQPEQAAMIWFDLIALFSITSTSNCSLESFTR